VLDQARALAEEATRAGRRAEFLAALTEINRRLETQAVSWGDPMFHYRHLGLLEYRAGGPLLHVYYAVDESRQLVHVTNFRLLLPGAE
jgi:hypothetical protein